jgi:hypothetical protein
MFLTNKKSEAFKLGCGGGYNPPLKIGSPMTSYNAPIALFAVCALTFAFMKRTYEFRPLTEGR